MLVYCDLSCLYIVGFDYCIHCVHAHNLRVYFHFPLLRHLQSPTGPSPKHRRVDERGGWYVGVLCMCCSGCTMFSVVCVSHVLPLNLVVSSLHGVVLYGRGRLTHHKPSHWAILMSAPPGGLGYGQSSIKYQIFSQDIWKVDVSTTWMSSNCWPFFK